MSKITVIKPNFTHIKNIVLFIIFILIINISSYSYGKNNENSENNKNTDNILGNTLGKTIAIVNNDVITDIEFNKKLNLVKTEIKNTDSNIPSEQALKKHVIDSMVLEKLELQIADMNGITISEQQLNTVIDNIAKQNNLNIYSFKEKLEKDGLNFNDYKKELTNQLIIMNLEKAIANSEIKISKQELAQELTRLKSQNNKNSYRLSHILISVPNNPDSDKIKYAQNRAEDIVKELKNGKDFKQIAMVVSDGQQALKGGDLGWYNYVDLPTIFADIVPTLKQGQIYGPIQSENGFHIIKLTDVKHDSNKYKETQYKVRHVLIQTDEITTNISAKKELNKLRDEILKNNNFAELALIYSEDKNSAAQGGSIGYVSLHSLVPEFANVIEKLKKGEISKPFKTPYGWHIAQLEDIKLIDNTKEYQELQAKQVIQSRKFNDALASWKNKILTESHIKVLI